MNLIHLLLRTSRFGISAAIIAGILSGGGSARLVALVNEVVNGRQMVTAEFLAYFFGLLLVVLVAGYISQLMLIRLAQGALLQLRLMLTRQILGCPLRRLEELGSHRLLAALTSDIEVISSAFSVIPFLCIDLAIVVGSLVYLAWLSLPLFLIMFAFIALATVTYQLIARRARRFLVQAREEQNQLFHHFRGIVNGTKELKLHYQRRQVFIADDLHQTASRYRHHNIMGMGIFAGAASWGQFLFFGILSLFLFVLPQQWNLPSPLVSSYILTIIYLTTPLENLMRRLPILSRASVALDQVESFGLMLHRWLEPPSTHVMPQQQDWQHLELRGVTHTYANDRDSNPFTLGPLHLTFYPREVVFIIGGNGSGKSTLAKLITGLYTPEAGEIWLDGKPVTDCDREAYRQQFSAIFADFYLFNRLIALDNSTLLSQAQTYLADLQLDHKVQIESGTLSTTALSQGQRKRLALLTAYLEDRPIYLFDEWAADQDPQFKAIFYSEILPELKRRGKLVLVITHDDKYFHLADRILKLESGQLVESKTAHFLP
ncbi:MAG: cyclic peptide export ABC transporter [Thainema sp.]